VWSKQKFRSDDSIRLSDHMGLVADLIDVFGKLMNRLLVIAKLLKLERQTIYRTTFAIASCSASLTS
jgi:hypothetical protein